VHARLVDGHRAIGGSTGKSPGLPVEAQVLCSPALVVDPWLCCRSGRPGIHRRLRPGTSVAPHQEGGDAYGKDGDRHDDQDPIHPPRTWHRQKWSGGEECHFRFTLLGVSLRQSGRQQQSLTAHRSTAEWPRTAIKALIGKGRRRGEVCWETYERRRDGATTTGRCVRLITASDAPALISPFTKPI
jgi:hypothetical protein